MSTTSEKLQYTLTLSTVSTGTGARDTARDLERVAQATANVSDKAQVGQWGVYNLDEQLKSSAKQSAQLADGLKKVGPAGRNSGLGVLYLSQAFEDAQYGMRGVLNNIPPLLMSLGIGAGLTGVVSIAAVSFSVLYNWFSKTEEKASDVADRFAEVGAKLENLQVDKLERIRNELEDDLELSRALEQKWGESQKAQDDYASAALDNATRLRAVQNGILELLGLEVDKRQELIAMAEQEEQKRALAHQQAVAAEKKRLADAQERAEALAEDLNLSYQDVMNTEKALANAKQRLEVLKQQKKELQEIAKQSITSEAWFEGDAKTPEAKAAQQKLDSAPFKQSLQTIEKQVENLEEALDSLVGPGGEINKQEASLVKAQTQAADIAAAVETNTQRLQEAFQIQEVEAKLKTAVEVAEQQAEDIKKAVGNIDVTNDAGKAAKAALEQAASDGKITADETAAVSRDLQTLAGQIQAGMAVTKSNSQELLNLMNQFGQNVARDHQEIQTLKKQIEVLMRTR